jgi:hypothetical protein
MRGVTARTRLFLTTVMENAAAGQQTVLKDKMMNEMEIV